MSFLDNALSSASSALSGGQPASSTQTDATPLYFKGDPIGQAPDGTGGSYAPNDTGAKDTGELIEFIHFGFVHADYSTNFNHSNSITDDNDAKLPQDPATPGSRAVMYRGALERETLLLGGMVASTQTVLQDREQNESGGSPLSGNEGAMVGAAVAEAGSLLGGGGSSPSSSGGVKSTDLNDNNTKVKTIGGNLNVAAVTYTITHQAGEDLAQARANYLQVLAKVAKPPAAQNAAGGGLLSQVSSVVSSIPGAGPIFQIIEGIATKVFDIYVLVFAQLATHCQLAIEKACHDVTIDAITNNKSPIFPVWFNKINYDPGDEGNLIDTSSGGGMGDSLSSLPGKLEDRGKDMAAQTAHKFLDVPTDDYPSAATLDKAFATDAPQPNKDQPPAPASQPSDLVAQAFSDALGLPVPDFLKTVISQIMETDVQILQELYKELLPWDQTKTIPADEILEAGRAALLDKLIDLVTSNLSFLQDLEKSLGGSNLLTPTKGKAVTSDEVMNRAGDLGKDEISAKLAPAIDPILTFAMGDLASKLDAIRSTAQAQKAVSMEVYLGRLPYLEALLFRNTFFPFWDLLVQTVFGKVGPLSGFLNSAGGFYKGAKDDVWKAQDDVSRGEAVANALGQGQSVGTGSGSNPLSNLQNAWSQGGTQQQQDPTAATMQQNFPISGRLNSATGTDITQDVWSGVTVITDSQYTNYPPQAAGSGQQAPAAQGT